MSVTGQFTTTHPPKECKTCGELFFKRSTLSLTQWAKKEFCTNRCRGIDLRRAEHIFDGRVWVYEGDRRRPRARVVMAQTVGRALESGEVVDHINGDPMDDRPENLRLFASQAAHMAAHWREGTIRRLRNTPGAVRWREGKQA